MPIRIVRPGREFAVPIGDATFQVRRMTDAEQLSFDAAHVPGSPARAMAYVKAVIVGWSNVFLEDGHAAAFDSELLVHLPYDTVLEPLLERLRGGPDPLAARAASATLPPSTGTPSG